MHDAEQPLPFQEPSNIFRYSTMELCSFATLYATGNEAAELCHALGRREATPSSSKESSSNVIVVHDAKNGAKGSKKRHKQRPQWVTATADYDDGNDKKTGGSDLGHIATAARSSKHLTRLPTNHIKRLLEEACLNHTYPIKHKLKDRNMMNNFMISGSLSRGMELNEDPDRSNTRSFHGEDVVMMVYVGRPPIGQHHVSNLSPRTPTRSGWGPRNTGV
jgi:hypothetical protein